MLLYVLLIQTRILKIEMYFHMQKVGLWDVNYLTFHFFPQKAEKVSKRYKLIKKNERVRVFLISFWFYIITYLVYLVAELASSAKGLLHISSSLLSRVHCRVGMLTVSIINWLLKRLAEPFNSLFRPSPGFLFPLPSLKSIQNTLCELQDNIFKITPIGRSKKRIIKKKTTLYSV